MELALENLHQEISNLKQPKFAVIFNIRNYCKFACLSLQYLKQLCTVA